MINVFLNFTYYFKVELGINLAENMSVMIIFKKEMINVLP